MKVKVFQTNSNGKIEFAPAELEKLLNETYTDGFRDGEAYHREKSNWTWTSPYLNNTLRSNDSATITGSNTKINKDLLAQISGATESKVEAPKIATTNNTTKPNAYTITTAFNAADAKEMSKCINEIIKNATARVDNDAFSKLAKELNF